MQCRGNEVLPMFQERDPSGRTELSSRKTTEQDFAAIASSCRPQIFRFLLLSLRDVGLAEELTHECLLRAHRDWAGFRGRSKAATWLMRIAVNLQRDYWRGRYLRFGHKHSIPPDELCHSIPSCETSPEAQNAAREQLVRVWKAVRNMGERQRTVFLLHFVEELKTGEIAEVTGWQVGTVKSHLSRALSKVHATLAQA
jgi:RNA polymerase sigma-70 factor, ECF subfamily